MMWKTETPVGNSPTSVASIGRGIRPTDHHWQYHPQRFQGNTRPPAVCVDRPVQRSPHPSSGCAASGEAKAGGIDRAALGRRGKGAGKGRRIGHRDRETGGEDKASKLGEVVAGRAADDGVVADRDRLATQGCDDMVLGAGREVDVLPLDGRADIDSDTRPLAASTAAGRELKTVDRKRRPRACIKDKSVGDGYGARIRSTRHTLNGDAARARLSLNWA